MGNSRLRPETCDARPGSHYIPRDTALFLIRDSVERRRGLIYGRLRDGKGVCAMGAFWDDNPRASVDSDLIDEVAAVNDSVKPGPNAPKLRWQKVRSWLRWKVRVMALKANG